MNANSADHEDYGDADDKIRHAFFAPAPQAEFDKKAARSHGWVSPEDYNRRVTELLMANNALIDRVRAAEDVIKTLTQAAMDVVGASHEFVVLAQTKMEKHR
jgi:hypothetical protein